MKLDVLICVHSKDDLHDRLLQRALESLVIQTYTDFSVIVILDECHEYTVDIVRKYKEVLDIRWFERPKKKTLAWAKNFGLSKSDADFIAFLDADDYYHEEKLQKQTDFLEVNPDIDFLFCQAYDVHPDESITDNCFKLGEFDTHDKILQELPRQNCLHHGTALIRKSCLDAIGGYPTGEQYKGLEDYVTWLKAINIGYKFHNLAFRGYYYSLGTSVPR